MIITLILINLFILYVLILNINLSILFFNNNFVNIKWLIHFYVLMINIDLLIIVLDDNYIDIDWFIHFLRIND